MPNYQNGKIYALRSPETNDIYIGSTTKLLCQRLSKHRNDYKRWQNGIMNYIHSFKLIQYASCYIELLENYPCNSKEELNRREGELIRANEFAINRRVEGRTKAEYRQENADLIAEKQHQFYEKHKQQMNIKRQEKLDCVCGAKVSDRNMARHRQLNCHGPRSVTGNS